MQHKHSKTIVRADVGCHNAISVESNRAKVIDLEGCSIDGGQIPYKEYESINERTHIMEQLYPANQDPDAANLPPGNLIQDCCSGAVHDMEEVIQALEVPESLHDPRGNVIEVLRSIRAGIKTTIRCVR